MQWYWTILPRIKKHLPCETILEIGPGFGRWTHYLRQECEHLVLVDLSEKCIHACRERFGSGSITYRVGDGESLEGVEDRSIDFCFSWETLVYTELDATRSYLRDLSQKLAPNGTAFLHHSNLAHYSNYFDRTIKLPKVLRDILKKRGLLDYDQWRARTVDAESFARCAEEEGLYVWSQELIPWGGKRLIDCFTILGKTGPRKPPPVLRNPHYHTEAYHIQRLSWLYGEGVPW